MGLKGGNIGMTKGSGVKVKGFGGARQFRVPVERKVIRMSQTEAQKRKQPWPPMSVQSLTSL